METVISKEIRIASIEKSWKFEGFCFVKTVDGKNHKRKVYVRKTGKFAGLNLINLDTDVYSFSWNGDKARDIKWVGNYKNIADIDKDPEIVVEVKKKAPVIVEVDDSGEIKHEKYNQIKTCVECNIPVYLVGPAGSGKNHTLEQIADELGLDFHFTNSVQQEFKLTGFIDAGGKYHETEFYRSFTQGGLFFLDEMDASVPEVLVLLNAAIANKYFEFPNGKVDAHKDFRVVAAGNTVGSGADEQYTGRLVLDQATLDRFAIIEFGYSLKVEMHLAKGNAELVSFVRDLRKQAEDKGVRATFSYRCISMVVKLEGKLELVDIMQMAIFKGFDKDTINTFRTNGTTNKYYQAMQRVQA